MGAQKTMGAVADGSTALSASNETAAFGRAVQQGVADADAGDVVAYDETLASCLFIASLGGSILAATRLGR